MVITKDETNLEEKDMSTRKNYYREIMFSDDFEKAEELFYEYLEHGSKRERKKVFSAILMKAESYEKAEELISHMKEYNFNADIQVYDILLKKMEDELDIVNLYNKLKKLCFIMDGVFLKRVADKMMGTDYYYPIQYERDCFKQIQEEAEKIENEQEVIDSIEYLFIENDIYESTYNYFVFISFLKRATLVRKCIEILDIKEIKPDEKIYMAVLNKLKEDKREHIIYVDILKNLQKQLNDEEKLRLIEILNYYGKEAGGETKWMLEKDKLIKEYENEILLENNIEKQQFLIGKVEALGSKSKGKNKKSQENLKEIIAETEAEEDFELYRLEISKLHGQLSGTEESAELYSSIMQTKMPILYILYAESREFQHEIENEYLQEYYYKLEEIKNEKVNSFIIANSAEEFIHYLNEVDYNLFDVRVKIYGDSGDSRMFYNKCNNNKSIYEYIYSNIKSKVCFLNYIYMQYKHEDKNKTAVEILSRDDIHVSNDDTLLDNYYTIKYIQSLKNKIDAMDADELIRLQKLGNYYMPILKGMLNRCIRTDQKDWKFVYTIMDYNEKKDIIKDVQNIEKIQDILGVIRIDQGRLEEVRTIINGHINLLEENKFFERIKGAEGLLAETIFIRIDNNEKILNRTLNQNIDEREEGRKSKTDLEKIPFKKLKKKFEDDEEFMTLILEVEEKYKA